VTIKNEKENTLFASEYSIPACPFPANGHLNQKGWKYVARQPARQINRILPVKIEK
jgi:hypothetical protein